MFAGDQHMSALPAGRHRGLDMVASREGKKDVACPPCQDGARRFPSPLALPVLSFATMRSLTTLLLTLSLGLSLGSLRAQTANDVGLQMSGGILTVIYGQMCGAVTCTPLTGGGITPGETR